jgi:hypothetical protein
MSARRRNLDEVLALNARARGDVAYRTGVDGYADEVGFHIYAELRLTLQVAAPEDSKAMNRYLDLIEQFAEISQGAIDLVSGRIFEVQGQVIHFFIQADSPDDVARPIAFATALVRMAYGQIKPLAGEGVWRGFAVAFDHGRTIMLSAPFGGGSLVSLGPAANRPAKRLGSGMPSGYLALPWQMAKGVDCGRRDGDWHLIQVEQASEDLSSFLDENLEESVGKVAKKILGNPRAAGREFVRAFGTESIGKKAFVGQGVCLRADLDGFTKAVKEAFMHGEVGVQALVEEFSKVMAYPTEFVRRCQGTRRVIELPWAGDCCTLFVMPNVSEGIDGLRGVASVELGREWHDIGENNAKYWKPVLQEAAWATGFASGGPEEGNGWVVVAEIGLGDRRFRIIAGWASRKAKDAQESPGVQASGIAIPSEDHKLLDTELQGIFRQEIGHPSVWITTHEKCKRGQERVQRAVRRTATPVLDTGKFAHPQPRPYAGWPC